MTPKEAAEALDLLGKSRNSWDEKKFSENVNEATDEAYVIPDEYSDCKVYNIAVLCWFGNEPYQFKIATLLTDAEAYAASNKFATVMYEMVKTGQSSFSIKLRGMNGNVVSRVFTNVVYIEHNIPAFKEVAEDENVDE